MPQPNDNLPARTGPQVAFRYRNVDVLADGERLVNLNQMWEASGKPANKDPRQWARLPLSESFVDELARSLNVEKSHIWKSKRGKHNGGTWAHWQIAMAYAKYLSHDFHRYVNAAFKEWAEEKADPGLKAERALAAYEQAGKDRDWIERRFKGIGTRKALTSTMADHNCKVGGTDNPYAEGTRAISLHVLGKTPKEIKEAKGLPASASTRDHLDLEELVSIEWAEIQARKLIRDEGAEGNRACVEACRRAGAAVKGALQALAKPAVLLLGFLGCSGCVTVNSPLWTPAPPLLLERSPCANAGPVLSSPSSPPPGAMPVPMPGPTPELGPIPEALPSLTVPRLPGGEDSGGARQRRLFVGR